MAGAATKYTPFCGSHSHPVCEDPRQGRYIGRPSVLPDISPQSSKHEGSPLHFRARQSMAQLKILCALFLWILLRPLHRTTWTCCAIMNMAGMETHNHKHQYLSAVSFCLVQTCQCTASGTPSNLCKTLATSWNIPETCVPFFLGCDWLQKTKLF